MSKSYTVYVRLCAMFFVLMFSSVAFGGATKVDVCHVPPGDPDNFHTITISEKAVPSHLKHGDDLGVCGDTEPPDPVATCPCFDQNDLDALTGAPSCTIEEDISYMEFVDGFVCTGECHFEGSLSCIYNATELELGLGEFPAIDEDTACRKLIATNCT